MDDENGVLILKGTGNIAKVSIKLVMIIGLNHEICEFPLL